MIRPDICLPVISSLRDAIAEEVKNICSIAGTGSRVARGFLPDMRKKYRRL